MRKRETDRQRYADRQTDRQIDKHIDRDSEDRVDGQMLMGGEEGEGGGGRVD